MSKKLNKDVPAPRQVWEHYRTNMQLLVINIKNDTALCALLDQGKVSKRRVVVPVDKFMFWGNRGMFLTGVRKGKLPAPGKDAGVYNTRNAVLGAR